MDSPILIGPRCTGKTSVGRKLADYLGIPHFDGDFEFEMEYGPINGFVAQYGWEPFRVAEAKCLAKLCAQKEGPYVLTPGGGAVAHDQHENARLLNVETLRNAGKLFYLLPEDDLERSAMILTERMRADPTSAKNRPALTQESDDYKEMLDVVRKRDPLYRAAAHEIVLTHGKSIDEVVAYVVDRVA